VVEEPSLEVFRKSVDVALSMEQLRLMLIKIYTFVTNDWMYQFILFVKRFS